MDKFRIEEGGLCGLCKKTPKNGEEIKCFICNTYFHGICTEGKDDKIGTKALITNYNQGSTKMNFKFFCDTCLTKFEIDRSKAETDRLNAVENNVAQIMSDIGDLKTICNNSNSNKSTEEMSLLKSELNEIKALLNTKTKSIDKPVSIWHNEEKLKALKVPPAEPMLVLNKRGSENNAALDKAIIENKIPVTKAYQNKSGDLVVVCKNSDSRDNLKKLIENSDSSVAVKAVSSKNPGITIVGLNTECTKDEVMNQLTTQNHFLQQFSVCNVLNEHLHIHDIKPTKARAHVYQVFASVSPDLRKGLQAHNDKVTIGLSVCKVYDRINIKRCNNCQGLGHFYKECPTPEKPICANCSLNHSTNTCTSSVKVCINCKNAGLSHNHSAFDPFCASIVAFKDSFNNKPLN